MGLKGRMNLFSTGCGNLPAFEERTHTDDTEERSYTVIIESVSTFQSQTKENEMFRAFHWLEYQLLWLPLRLVSLAVAVVLLTIAAIPSPCLWPTFIAIKYTNELYPRLQPQREEW